MKKLIHPVLFRLYCNFQKTDHSHQAGLLLNAVVPQHSLNSLNRI